MAAAARPNPGDPPDSPYATELHAIGPNGRFSPELEAEYLRIDLIRNRGIIRTVCLCAVIVSVAHTIEQVVEGFAGALLLTQLGLVVTSSIVLAALAWTSEDLQHRYQPWASILVPLRGTIIAAHVAQAAAQGEIVLLMTLPAMLICGFFFLGLKFRVAFFSAVATLASFACCAALYELPLPITVRSCLYLLATLVGCLVAARQLESRSRISFVEGHLIAELAQRDALTGAKNRRVFNEHLARIWLQAAADRRALSILLIDVDHFKAYNDRYGHLAGDDALRRVARAVQASVHRPLDLVARYGGEEFAVILYDVPGSQAQEIAERMRLAVMDLGVEHRASRTAEMVTISIGVAAIEPRADRECRGALQLADQALYEAKIRGRNTVELMDDTEYQFLVTGVFSTGFPEFQRTGQTSRPSSQLDGIEPVRLEPRKLAAR